MKKRPSALLLAVATIGCCSPATNARPALASADAAVTAVAAVYEAEQQACLDAPAPDACIAAIRARWAPARAALTASLSALHAVLGAQ